MNKVKLADAVLNMRRGFDHIGVSVPIVIHDGNGKILLHKRSKNARDEHGRWDLGGGAVELHEKFEDAVRRELMEEFGAEALEVEFIHMYEAHREHNGEPTHWIAVMHAAKVDPATVIIGEPDKIDEIGWFGLDDLPDPLHSMFPVAKPHIIEAGLIR